jgi:N-acetyl-alpha-D-muramate 1-phosphate uridylyltransferase
MSDSVAGVVLAAGVGTRLLPLTHIRPKALCPVADVPLVDLAIERAATAVGTPSTESVAVNVHAGREQMEEHLDGRVHLSIEERAPLGTAGGLARLRDWIAGRPAVVLNADAWCPGSLAALVGDWDGTRIRLLLAGDDDLRPRSRIAGALMPWPDIASLPDEPSGLYEVSWARAAAEGRIEAIRHDGPFIDCGTPADYLAANLAANGGESVVGAGAVVEGEIVRSVIWPGAVVWPGEHLVDAIRANQRTTVLVR